MISFIKKISLSFALILGSVLLSNQAYSADENTLFDMKNPHVLIKNASEKTFARFRAERELINKDLNHLKVIVEEELMPYINHKRAAASVLGNKHYRQVKAGGKFDEFSEAFRQYLILTYANVFTLYDDQKIVYASGTETVGQKVVTVKVKIIDSQRPPIAIEFKLRKSKKSGDWKAYDMVAGNGLSMVSTKAKEFDGIINKKGIDYLITQLYKKSAESVEAKAK
jgi:phospholipid transport system substrate-binding protein